MTKGFDIVVGNPPYIRQEKIDDLAGGLEYKSMLAKVFAEEVKTTQKPDNKLGNTMDFSMYFIIRSRQLLRNGGHHSFIITNKWLRTSYGEPIRHFLKHNTELKKFIDFVNIKVFQGVSVDVVVYVLCKSDRINGHISFCCPTTMDAFKESDHDYYCEQQLLDDKVWSFSDPLTEVIKQWIESKGTPLKDMDVKINRGITTGYNDAFLIKTETRNGLIARDPKCAEIIKPLVKGKNINRYNIEWDDWWLIRFESGRSKQMGITNEDEFKDTFPSLYEHFESFFDIKGKGKGLKNRCNQGEFWWELCPCKYYEEFEKPKIISTKASDKPSFVLDYNNHYLLNTSYVFNTDSKIILAILNSSLSEFYIKESMSQLGDNFEPKADELEEFPVILADYPVFDLIVDYLHLNKNNFKQIVDCLVYEFYFHSIFNEDGLYPEDEMYLLDAVKSHLQPIQYDEWSKLDWKRQLGEITEEESERLDALTEENSNIIEEVVDALKNDEVVKKWVKIIKTHEWVKKIEARTQ
jgi:hypothetical protein